MPAFASHSPHRVMEMSPIPMASVTPAPQASSSFARIAASPPPGSPATSDSLDARSREVPAPLARPFRKMKRIGRRHHGGCRLQKLDCRDKPLGVPGSDRDVTKPEPVEHGERGAGDERAGVVGRDDAFAADDSRGRIGSRRGPDPNLDVGGGERNVARRPGRAAGRIDARDLLRVGGAMRPDRLIRRARRAQFVLLGERQRMDRLEPADGAVGRVTGALELAAIEARALEQIFDLLEVERRVEARLVLHGAASMSGSTIGISRSLVRPRNGRSPLRPSRRERSRSASPAPR